MTTNSSLARRHTPHARMPKRFVVLCVASLLLHLLAIEWANGNIGIPSWHDKSDTMITAALHPAPAPAPPPSATAPSAPKKAKPRTAARSTPQPAPQATPSAITDPTPAQTDAGMEAPGTSVESVTEIPTPEAPAATPDTSVADNTEHASQEAAQRRYKVNPPPSAELKYDVKKVPREGNAMYGHGTISWQSDGGNYVINAEAGVLFITALTFKSDGTIDDFGLAPLLYSERRFRRPETNTHFHRERNTISFSASEISYPRKGGEQDRASFMWQLAGIGRGDAQNFTPDAEIDIFVAGVRDGETWRIRVIGQEEIDIGNGKTNAWHVVRAPRAGSYDQKIDIWLAPQYEWYPVKLRYTEHNGDYLDLSLSNMKTAAAR